jgi:hypothetical protein
LLVIVATVTAVRLRGPTVADALRDLFAALTPLEVLRIVALLSIAGVIGSFAAGGMRTPKRAALLLNPIRSRLSRLADLPPLIALTCLVAIAAAFRVVLVAAETIPFVLGDQLVYSGIAKSFALHGEPLLRGDLAIGYSFLYPLYAGPAYLLSADGAAAFANLKIMNAVAMALAAVPAYFLGSRILSRRWSLGVAVLTAFAPWTGYAAFTMTEPLFYPAFTAFALVVVRMLERPSPRRQLMTLLTLLVLIGIRPQALALAGSIVAAIILSGLLTHSLLRTLEIYAPTLVGLGCFLTAGAVASAAGLPLPTGAYHVLFHSGFDVVGIAKWGAWNLALYELGIGVVALAAFALTLSRLLRGAVSDAERAFGIGALTLFGGILFSVAVLSASPYGLGRLHERSLFYVTPLVLVGFAYWLAHGLARGRGVAFAISLVAVSLPMALPGNLLVLKTNNVDGPTTSLVIGFNGNTPGIPAQYWVVAFAIIAVAVFLLARRPLFPLVSVVLAFATVTAMNDYRGPLSIRQDRALAWVDHVLPSGATATIVHVDIPPDPAAPCSSTADTEQRSLVVWTEFFNTRVDRLYHVYGPVRNDGLASPELSVVGDGLLLDEGSRVHPEYVVIDSRQPIVGERVARFDQSSLGIEPTNGASLSLWKVQPPLRLAPRLVPLPPRPDGRSC